MAPKLERRTILKMIPASVMLASAPVARSQSPSPSLCPPGHRQEFEVWTETAYVEVSLNATKYGGGGSGKVPRRVIQWKLKCIQEPSPPPPPPKPVPKHGLYFDDLYRQSSGLLMIENAYFAAQALYIPVGLPSFARIASPSATMTMTAYFSDNRSAALTSRLVQDLGGFVIESPGPVDYWMATTASSAIAGTWTISDIQLEATSASRGSFGIGAYYGSHPVFGSAGTLASTSIDRTIGTTEIQ